MAWRRSKSGKPNDFDVLVESAELALVDEVDEDQPWAAALFAIAAQSAGASAVKAIARQLPWCASLGLESLKAAIRAIAIGYIPYALRDAPIRQMLTEGLDSRPSEVGDDLFTLYTSNSPWSETEAHLALDAWSAVDEPGKFAVKLTRLVKSSATAGSDPEVPIDEALAVSGAIKAMQGVFDVVLAGLLNPSDGE